MCNLNYHLVTTDCNLLEEKLTDLKNVNSQYAESECSELFKRTNILQLNLQEQNPVPVAKLVTQLCSVVYVKTYGNMEMQVLWRKI